MPVGQLTGGVAHDFNNLLTVVVGNLDLLLDLISDNTKFKKPIDTALRAALRGRDLTQRLLAFSRTQLLAPKPMEVNECVSTVAGLMRRTLGEDVEIETVLADGLWQAMADESQLENVLLNLALNSRDAMPEGGGLTIETANSHLDQEVAERESEVSAGDYVMITVSDTGMGMAPEIVRRCFEPFFTTKEIGQGSGLGLSMVYGFIKQSGGHVAIDSEPGRGTAVKLYLPRAAVTEPRDFVPGTARQTTLPTGDETIFVVEDDADVRAFVCAILKDLGYHVLEAADGPSAVAVMEDNSAIDLLLTDTVLPGGMSGGNIAEEFNKRYPNGLVLYTSVYDEDDIVRRGRWDRGTRLLAKPYRAESLAQIVRNTLDS